MRKRRFNAEKLNKKKRLRIKSRGVAGSEDVSYVSNQLKSRIVDGIRVNCYEAFTIFEITYLN